jgi:hypothetical protein
MRDTSNTCPKDAANNGVFFDIASDDPLLRTSATVFLHTEAVVFPLAPLWPTQQVVRACSDVAGK